MAHEHGTPITTLRRLLNPGESRCRCLFEAASADPVQAAIDAQIPYSRIVLTMELPGP